MASRRQIEAARRNALRSTGPRTPEGKRESSKNSYRHGMAGRGAVLPDEERQAIAERCQDWSRDFRPATEFQRWKYEEVIVTESFRVERCNRQERELLGQAAEL